MTVNFDRLAIKAIASAGFCLGALALSPHAVAAPLMTGGGYQCVQPQAGSAAAAAAGPAGAGAAPCAATALQSSGSIVPAAAPVVPLAPPVPVVPPLVPPVVPPPLVPPVPLTPPVPPVVPPPLVPPVPLAPPVPVVPIAAGAPVAAPGLAGAPLMEMSGAVGKGDVISPSAGNGPPSGVPALPGPKG